MDVSDPKHSPENCIRVDCNKRQPTVLVVQVSTTKPVKQADKPVPRLIQIQSAAILKVWTTGRCNTSRKPHQPAPQASKAPAAMPVNNTHGEARQWNSNT